MRLFILCVLICAPLLGCAQQSDTTLKRELMINNPTILMKTTEGEIKIELFADQAPLTTSNFLDYVKNGHYNGTIFHRVIDGFMVQGGGFTPMMKEKPTKAPIKNEADNNVQNKRGTIAMARTSDVHSASAQFYINVADNDFLNFKNTTPMGYGYCVFGQVISGMDVVDKIKKVPTTAKGGHQDVPSKPIEILSVEVVK